MSSLMCVELQLLTIFFDDQVWSSCHFCLTSFALCSVALACVWRVYDLLCTVQPPHVG